MILVMIILLPIFGGLAAWFSERINSMIPRWISLFTLLAGFVLALSLSTAVGDHNGWLAEFNHEWISQLGVSFHLAADGISLLLVLLTFFLGIMSVAASWTEIRERVGLFHLHLMLELAGIIGVFLAMDLFLFYFFWELMLIPMYFLIALWGHENRHYAATKFFLFTQAGGLLMLVSIMGLYFAHGRATGTYTFDYFQLVGTQMTDRTAFWLMLGFLAAFAVKLPVIPFHTWLPDAHTEAPTAGSVVLAGLLLKTGAYGMIRFAMPLFPAVAHSIAPVAMALGMFGVLYGAGVAFAQTDLKRLIAYTSVSHMGFVLVGIFAGNELSLKGAVIQIICHGISTGALFIFVGGLQERINTRDMGRMGGLWETVPRMSTVALFFALASLGLPGLGNFIGEFLILLGAYKVDPFIAIAATLGFILAVAYSLWIIQRVFQGPNVHNWKIPDLGRREMAMMAIMIAFIVWLGIYPQPVLDIVKPVFKWKL